MSGKVAVVTGANAGIGKVTAIELARQGARVFMVCRSRERGERALREVRAAAASDAVDLVLADMGRKADIERMAEEIGAKADRVSVLVNNAGIYLPGRELTDDGFEAMLGINHLGYYLAAHALLDLLKAGAPSRIVNVASEAHRFQSLDWDDLQATRRFRGLQQYGRTKLMNILFTRGLAERLPASITANALHPGVIASEFGQDRPSAFQKLARLGRFFLLSPEKGARTSIFLASAPEVEGITGRYFIRRRERRPSRQASDPEAARRLWRITAELTGVDRL